MRPELRDRDELTNALRKAGSVRKVATAWGVHHQTVLDACGKLGIDPVTVTNNRGKRSEGIKTPDEIRKMLAKGPQPLPILAEAMGLTEPAAALALEQMRADGYSIKQSGSGLYLDKSAVITPTEVEIEFYGREFVFAEVADSHLSSMACKLQAFHEFYRIAKTRGAQAVFHDGDVFAGMNMYPGQMHEVIPGEYSYDGQLQRGVNDYPHEEGMDSWVIGGNHDGSFMKAIGADIVQALAYRRPDIHYLGPMSGRVKLQGTEVIHEKLSRPEDQRGLRTSTRHAAHSRTRALARRGIPGLPWDARDSGRRV
jgi:biotin operon repressor